MFFVNKISKGKYVTYTYLSGMKLKHLSLQQFYIKQIYRLLIINNHPFNRTYVGERNLCSIFNTYWCYGGTDLRRCVCGTLWGYDQLWLKGRS